MKKRYYAAYGSNLNLIQMCFRCPGAEPVGTALVRDHRLAFKGRRDCAYLTIEPCEGAKVPVGIYSVTAADEESLDRYEGYPRFYRKEEMKLSVTDMATGRKATRTVFIYIMDESRGYGLPDKRYMDICRDGYEDFGFDPAYLKKAYRESRERAWKRQPSE